MTSFEDASKGVLDTAAPLDVRIRALYAIKAYRREKPAEVAQVLLEATDSTTSVLLQHEFLYNVGQIGLPANIPQLQAIIANNDKYDVVSRHEAIEAIGAIGLMSAKDGEQKTGATDALDYLVQIGNDPKSEQPIVESCLLAVERIGRIDDEGAASYAVAADAEFVSVDPTPAPKAVTALMVEVQKQRAQTNNSKELAALEEQMLVMSVDLGKAVRNEKASLWDRYQAMFGLRDLGSDAAVAELATALLTDKSSSLFRHEVAFVLGQLENATSSPALIASLRDEKEHPMVRHEAAEALGAVASKSDWEVLAEYAKHKEALVADSCVVALDMHAYWTNFNKSNNVESEEKGAGEEETR